MDVDKEFDERLIIEVSQHIDDYETAGHYLKLTDEVLKEITQKKSDVIERNNAVLWAWKRKNGSTATSSTLVKVFLKLQDRFVAESILKLLTNQKTEPHQPNIQVHLHPQKANYSYESEKRVIKNDLMEKNRSFSEIPETVFDESVKDSSANINESKINGYILC